MAAQYIRVGNTLTNIIDSITGESVNYDLVTTWKDGTPMDDSKTDGTIYRKLGTEYFKRVYDGVVNVRWFGAKGDGVTNDTIAIQTALDVADKIFFDSGTYMVDATKDNGLGGTGNRGLLVGNNKYIFGDKTATIKALPTDLPNYNVFLLANCNNITIRDLIIKGERNEHIGTGGEFGFGINMRTASNIILENIEVSDFWGDGILISRFVFGEYCENIKISKVDCNNNRRQGMSVASVDGLFVTDCTFNTTNGTAPQFGIDIEPDNPQERIANVFLKNITMTDNSAGGLLIALGLMDETSYPVSIDVDTLKVINTAPDTQSSVGYYGVSMSSHGSFDKDIKGTIKIRNLDSDNTLESSLAIVDWINMPDVYVENVKASRAGRTVQSTVAPRFSGIQLNQTKLLTRLIRRPIISIKNVDITMWTKNNTIVHAGYFSDLSATPDNTIVENIRVYNNPVNTTRIINTLANNTEVKTPNVIAVDANVFPDISAVNFISTKNATAKRGVTLYSTQNNTITIYNDSTFGVDLNLFNRLGQFLNIPSSTNRQLHSSVMGSSITIKRVSDNNWRVLNMTGTWELRNFENEATLDIISNAFYNIADGRFRITGPSGTLFDQGIPATNAARGTVLRADAVLTVTTPNATDLATAIALANSLKTTLNDLIVKERAAGQILP